MREMKDSGVDWIGEVPASWDMLRIYQLAFPVKNKNEGMKENNLLSLSYGNIVQKDINKVDGLVPASYEGYNIIEPGDIVLRFTDLQNDQRSLRTGLCSFNGIITSAYLTIRPRHELVSSEYFHYVLHFVDTLKVFYNMGGGMRQSLDWHGVSHMFLPIPPQAEQCRIVAYLDERCAAIDEDVAKRREVIEKLKEYKKSLIAHAVTKGLDPNAEMRDSGVEWIGEVPAGWEIHYPKALFFMRNERMKPGDTQLTASQEYGVIPQSEFQEREGRRVVQVILNPDILKHVEVGDFVMHMRSFQGGLELAYQSGCVSSAYVMLRRRTDKVRESYFKYLFKSSAYIDALRSTSNLIRDGQALRFANFIQVYLPLPSIDEQDKIAVYLDERCAAIDEAVSRQEKLIEKLGEYRKSIIHHAVTGKIDCTEA